MKNRDKKQGEKLEIFLCPVCTNRQKAAGPPICEECEAIYEKEVVEAIRNHQQPEEKWAYALRKAEENLTSCQKELTAEKEFTATYWEKALKEVKAECQGIQLSRDSFLAAVHIRFEEILERAGLEQTAADIKALKYKVRALEKAAVWLEKVIQQRQVGIVPDEAEKVTA